VVMVTVSSVHEVGAVAHRPNAEKMVSNNSSSLTILEPQDSSVKPSSLVQALFLQYGAPEAWSVRSPARARRLADRLL
jgi:hypothetical protein